MLRRRRTVVIGQLAAKNYRQLIVPKWLFGRQHTRQSKRELAGKIRYSSTRWITEVAAKAKLLGMKALTSYRQISSRVPVKHCTHERRSVLSKTAGRLAQQFRNIPTGSSK